MHINDLPDSVHERLSQQDIVKLESILQLILRSVFSAYLGMVISSLIIMEEKSSMIVVIIPY